MIIINGISWLCKAFFFQRCFTELTGGSACSETPQQEPVPWLLKIISDNNPGLHSWFFGSGPKGVNDLCFHIHGEFSPSPTSPPQILVWRTKFQSPGPNPSLKAQIPSWPKYSRCRLDLEIRGNSYWEDK